METEISLKFNNQTTTSQKRCAKVTNGIELLLFYAWPLLATIVIHYAINRFSIKVSAETNGVAASISSSWIGYSFAAAFFLIALPRSGLIKKLDRRKLFSRYSIAILLPALAGTLHLLSLIFFKDTPPKTTCPLSLFLLIMTCFYALWSMLLLVSIIFLKEKQ